ncbi:MAG: class II fructose-bisphosphate aldolase [Bacteroidales bacterium]|nr:class II fructose-bisphosphate aldolase [Bacteroidales bacterium]
MLISPSLLFEKCYGKYAIAAINVWNMEQVHALFRAAQSSKAPFIVQVTPVALDYGHQDMLLSMIKAAAGIYPETIFSIHLDHGTSQIAMEAISSGGFSSVMIDASHATYEKNIDITKKIVEKAHAAGMQVEAELGVLSGVEDDLIIEAKARRYTRPGEVENFVRATGCDSLAIAIGTSHGAYKFSGDQSLQFNILEEIQQRLPGFPLVLHGGSAVDMEEIGRINASGGRLGTQARGVPSREIRKSITYGICKVNIATDARIVWTRIHREHFNEHPEQIDPILPGRTYMEGLEKLYKEKFSLLGATNKTRDLKS